MRRVTARRSRARAAHLARAPPTRAAHTRTHTRAARCLGDELEEVIAKGGTLAHMSDTACVELTGVCEGIDWKAPTGVPGYEEYTPPEPQPTAASPAGRKKGKKSKKRLQHSGKDEV